MKNTELANTIMMLAESQISAAFEKVNTLYIEKSNTVFINVKRANLVYACISNSKEWDSFVSSLVKWNKTFCNMIHDTYKTDIKICIMVVNDVDETKTLLSLLDGEMIIDCRNALNKNKF